MTLDPTLDPASDSIRARAWHATSIKDHPGGIAVDTGTRTAAGFAIQSQIAEFCVESEAVAPRLPGSFPGRRARCADGADIEEGPHRLHHRVSDLAAPAVRGHGLEVLLVGHIAKLHQDRGDIRRLEHHEARRATRLLVHPRGVAHFA